MTLPPLLHLADHHPLPLPQINPFLSQLLPPSCLTLPSPASKPTNQRSFTGSYTKSEEFLQECETYIELTEPSASDRAKNRFYPHLSQRPCPLRMEKAVHRLEEQSNGLLQRIQGAF